MLGDPGAGKSTFATLMSDCPLLSDEFNVVTNDNGVLTAHATPLRSSSPRLPNNISAPLGAILFPVKDSKDFLEPVDPARALPEIVRHAVIYDEATGKPSFSLLATIARQVPCFRFHFRKDPACRRLLDELPLR